MQLQRIIKRRFMAEGSNPGEDRAWEILALLKPEEVCKAAAVTYDGSAAIYSVSSFGLNFAVSVKDRTITSASPGSEALFKRLSYFFRLSVLWYLVNAKDIACTGRPVKLEHLKGGDFFTRGSHVLPLDAMADKYRKNKEEFIERGVAFHGELVKNGDVALRFSPFPRIPATLTLWLEDDEFPAKADLLLDSTCELQMPLDIIWSIAMMTVLIMM
jgi:hypothetical protein